MKRRLLLANLGLIAALVSMPSCAPSPAGPGLPPETGYDSLIIEPIEISIEPTANPLIAEQLAADYQSALRSVFSKRYRLTGEPGPRTLHLKARLSDGTGAPVQVFTRSQAKLQGTLGPAVGVVSGVAFHGEILTPEGRSFARFHARPLGSGGKLDASTHWMVPRSLAETNAVDFAEKLP